MDRTRLALRIAVSLSAAALAVLASRPAFCAIEKVGPGPALLKTLLAHAPIKIRVRLAEGSAVARIHGLDLQIYESTVPPGRRALSFAADKTEWEFRCQDGRVRAIPVNGSRAYDLRAPVSVHSAAGVLHLEGRPYREELRVVPAGSLCEVINVVDLEKYLVGLVNAEFSSKWSEEAAAAQVVAARTYALHQILASQAQQYDVESNVYDQAYDGFAREDYRASRIVRRTAGLVLTGAGEREPVPIKAFYHSTCGGHTELPENVWGVHYAGFKHTVSCPYCANAPKSQWELELSSQAMGEAIVKGARREQRMGAWPANWAEILDKAKLVDVKTRNGGSAAHRVSEVLTVWQTRVSSRLALPVTANQFRSWIGASKLRSTVFQIVPGRALASLSPLSWRIEGRGNGHGVGMCQWGAKVMGEKGFKMSGILSFYYPDAVLHKMW